MYIAKCMYVQIINYVHCTQQLGMHADLNNYQIFKSYLLNTSRLKVDTAESSSTVAAHV